MIRVKYKLWYASVGMESETTVAYHNTYPAVGDTIRYKDKFFTVLSRVFNLNNEDFTIIHCEERDVESTDFYHK